MICAQCFGLCESSSKGAGSPCMERPGLLSTSHVLAAFEQYAACLIRENIKPLLSKGRTERTGTADCNYTGNDTPSLLFRLFAATAGSSFSAFPRSFRSIASRQYTRTRKKTNTNLQFHCDLCLLHLANE